MGTSISLTVRSTGSVDYTFMLPKGANAIVTYRKATNCCVLYFTLAYGAIYGSRCVMHPPVASRQGRRRSPDEATISKCAIDGAAVLACGVGRKPHPRHRRSTPYSTIPCSAPSAGDKKTQPCVNAVPRIPPPLKTEPEIVPRLKRAAVESPSPKPPTLSPLLSSPPRYPGKSELSTVGSLAPLHTR